MTNEIKQLFGEVVGLTGYNITGERNKDRSNGETYYKTNFLTLDYNSIYGGYVIKIVLKNTGETDFDGLARRPKKEMINYLKGLIKGLTFNK